MKFIGGTVAAIAAICHEFNRVICKAQGDHSQTTWDEAPEWQKQSAIDGVMVKLANPDTTPEQMHKHWVDHKLEEGWRRGDVKDVEKKLHPCMVPYVDLPVEQRIKDHVFSAVVELLAPTLSAQQEVAPPAASVPSDLPPAGSPTETSPVSEAPVETPAVNSVGVQQTDGSMTDVASGQDSEQHPVQEGESVAK